MYNHRKFLCWRGDPEQEAGFDHADIAATNPEDAGASYCINYDTGEEQELVYVCDVDNGGVTHELEYRLERKVIPHLRSKHLVSP